MVLTRCLSPQPDYPEECVWHEEFIDTRDSSKAADDVSTILFILESSRIEKMQIFGIYELIFCG